MTKVEPLSIHESDGLSDDTLMVIRTFILLSEVRRQSMRRY